MNQTIPVDTASAGDPPEPPRRLGLMTLLPPTLLSAGVWVAAKFGYLLAHTVAEFFSIVVAMTAMVVATTSRRFTRNHFAVFVSVAIGWCAVLDLVHTVAFKGMGLLPVDSANPATQLWIIARLIQAVALVVAPLMIVRQVAVARLHLVFGLLVLACLMAVGAGIFPDAYVDGEGLTPFKVYAEYLVIAMLGASLVLLWRRRELLPRMMLLGMTASVVAMMASEFAFTRYVSVYSQSNLAGHVLKIYAYWFVYMALVRSTLAEPFAMLSRAASTYDAIPEPTFVVRPDGIIQQANAHAARRFGRPAAWFAGQHAHALLHDDRTPAHDCPVCQHLGQRGGAMETLLALPADEFAECHVAPFGSGHEDWTAWVMVVRDVTERERLKRDRERLVFDLGERVKELRCLGEVSQVCSETGLAMPQLLERVLQALPAGFERPQQVQLSIDSPWGRFGPALPVPRPQAWLDIEIRHDAATGGRLLAWYPDTPGGTGRFMPEEANLLGSVSSRIAEAATRQRAQERVRRLTYLHELLGDTNRAIVRSSSPTQLKIALQQALLTQGAFPKIFMATATHGGRPWRLEFQHGFEPPRLPMLEQVLAREDGPLGPLDPALRAGRVGVLALDEASPAGSADFVPWLDYLRQEGVRNRALMPLMQEGRLVAVVGLYATGSIPFDHEQVRVLEDLAADVSFALERFAAEERRHAAEAASRESEQRFRNMVEHTLAAMFVRREGRFLYVNPRFCEIVGWTAGELLGQDVLAFTERDPANQARIREAWKRLHAGGGQDTAYTVPMRHKDGRMIELGLNARVIQWDDGQPATIVMAQDITEQHRAQERIASYVKQLEATVHGTLQAVASMVEMRDPYTAGHERRVGLIAAAIAREMGWDEARCQTLEMVGLVHDVGKIAVPSEILTKPTRLSPLEMELVRGHAEAGYEILRKVPFPTPVAEIARQHHERMDGSGYPQGLRGEQILPEARVLAVADVIESMASHRPYRAALGLEVAMAEIAKGRATLFDPEVCDALSRLVRDKGYQLPA